MAAVDVSNAGSDMYQQQSPESPNGVVFLGQQEIEVPASISAVGTGWVEYHPEVECGGPKGTPGRQCPYSSHRMKDTEPIESSLDTRLIHVSIASYRDPQCADTLLSLFYNSVNPKSIRVKLLLQTDPNHDVDCVEEYCQLATKMKGKRRGNVGRIARHGDCPHSDQIHVRRMNADVAKGPMHARSIVSEMVATSHADGEIDTQDFCLSIDSHTEFGHDWDKDMVEMFREAENEYAILSTRPADLDQLGTTKEGCRQVPHLCSVAFTSNVVSCCSMLRILFLCVVCRLSPSRVESFLCIIRFLTSIYVSARRAITMHREWAKVVLPGIYRSQS